MSFNEIRYRSRWLFRVMEWDDAKARYPNLWYEGMPRETLVSRRVAGRLRLGDLIAIYYPASHKHVDRAERFVGISRVSGLRHADVEDQSWITLETAHRFDPPLNLGDHPRRVFMCCDPGWTGPEVEMFEKVFDAAVAAGWQPTEEEAAPPPEAQAAPPASEERAQPVTEQAGALRLFGGVDYSGDMRDPRKNTWLAVLELRDDRLRVTRLDATGRSGLQASLRDPDRVMMAVEAIGLDFPFGLPISFARFLLGGDFPEEGWWALVHRLEKLSRPDYLIALQEFRDAHGEPKRMTDETARACSPLHRVNPDLGPMTFHGIRMIAEDRSRFAVRPFETAQGRLLLEVYPGALIRQLGSKIQKGQQRTESIVSVLGTLDDLPVVMDESFRKSCLGQRDALDAVIAARAAARAVITGETDLKPDELAPGHGERIRHEGWIYGIG